MRPLRVLTLVESIRMGKDERESHSSLCYSSHSRPRVAIYREEQLLLLVQLDSISHVHWSAARGGLGGVELEKGFVEVDSLTVCWQWDEFGRGVSRAACNGPREGRWDDERVASPACRGRTEGRVGRGAEWESREGAAGCTGW